MKKAILTLMVSLIAILPTFGVTPGSVAVQDSFLGIRLGTVIRIDDVIKGISGSGKGYFSHEYSDGGIHSIVFNNVFFAGHRWNYCDFVYSDDDVFYWFRVYDSMPEKTDTRETATKIFNIYKSKMDSKYGKVEIEGGQNSTSAIYKGNNRITARVFNERSKTGGNFIDRFVGLEYIEMNTFSKLTQKEDNDL